MGSRAIRRRCSPFGIGPPPNRGCGSASPADRHRGRVGVEPRQHSRHLQHPNPPRPGPQRQAGQGLPRATHSHQDPVHDSRRILVPVRSSQGDQRDRTTPHHHRCRSIRTTTHPHDNRTRKRRRRRHADKLRGNKHRAHAKRRPLRQTRQRAIQPHRIRLRLRRRHHQINNHRRPHLDRTRPSHIHDHPDQPRLPRPRHLHGPHQHPLHRRGRHRQRLVPPHRTTHHHRTPQQIHIYQARTALVDHTCTEHPTAPGC